MENEGFVNIVLGCVTAYLAVMNLVLQSRRDTKGESRSLTAVEVKLDQLLASMDELKKELAGNKADLECVKERVIRLEARVDQMDKKE